MIQKTSKVTLHSEAPGRNVASAANAASGAESLRARRRPRRPLKAAMGRSFKMGRWDYLDSYGWWFQPL